MRDKTQAAKTAHIVAAFPPRGRYFSLLVMRCRYSSPRERARLLKNSKPQKVLIKAPGIAFAFNIVSLRFLRCCSQSVCLSDTSITGVGSQHQNLIKSAHLFLLLIGSRAYICTEHRPANISFRNYIQSVAMRKYFVHFEFFVYLGKYYSPHQRYQQIQN